MTQPYRQSDIAVSFVLRDHEKLVRADKAEKGGALRVHGKPFQVGGHDPRDIEVVKKMPRKGKESRAQGIGFGYWILFHETELGQGVEEGVALALVNPDLVADLDERHLMTIALAKAKEHSGGLIDSRNNGIILGSCLDGFCSFIPQGETPEPGERPCEIR
jgi:hypothetical protein